MNKVTVLSKTSNYMKSYKSKINHYPSLLNGKSESIQPVMNNSARNKLIALGMITTLFGTLGCLKLFKSLPERFRKFQLADGTVMDYSTENNGIHTKLHIEYKPDGSRMIKSKDGTIIESFDKDGNLKESLIRKILKEKYFLSKEKIKYLKRLGIKVVGLDKYIHTYYLLNGAVESVYDTSHEKNVYPGNLVFVRDKEFQAYYEEETGRKCHTTPLKEIEERYKRVSTSLETSEDEYQNQPSVPHSIGYMISGGYNPVFRR